LEPDATPTPACFLVEGLVKGLSWRLSARFRAVLMDGEEVEMRGIVTPPFGISREGFPAR